MAGNGCNQDVLSQMIGHTTTRTTSRYVAAVPEYHQKAMNEHEKNVLAMLSNNKPNDEGGDKNRTKLDAKLDADPKAKNAD